MRPRRFSRGAAQGNATGATPAEAADAAQTVFPWGGAERTKTLREIDLHRTVAQFLDWCLQPPAFYSTFPAGWDRMSKSRAGMLNGCGLKSGMPDLLLFHQGRTIGIELKTPKGRLSEQQKYTIEKLQAAGVPVFVCRNVDEVEKLLRDLQIPLTGSVRAA